MILEYKRPQDFQDEYVDCVICGESQTRYYDRVNDRQFVQCCQCKLVYQNPRISRQLLLKKGMELYDNKYFYNKENTRSKVNKARLSLYDSEISSLKKYCSADPLKIFDVGCGTGRFLAYLPEEWEKHGCDITGEGVRIAREEYQLKNIRLGEFESIDIPKNYFDVVYFRATMHHIYNPLTSLIKANQILKENGILVILVNCRTGLSGKLLRCGTRTVNPRVTYFFDEKSIGTLLERTGFELRDTSAPYWGSGYESVFDFPQLVLTAVVKRLVLPVLSLFGVGKNIHLVGPAWKKNSVFYFAQKKAKA